MGAKKLVNITELVDELGKTKAQIADLEKVEKKSVDTLKARGVSIYSGTLFEANVYEQERNKQINYEELAKAAKIDKKLIAKYTAVQQITSTTVDWETIIKMADIDPALVEKHTTSQKILICKVSARG